MLVGKPKGDLGKDMRIILKQILNWMGRRGLD